VKEAAKRKDEPIKKLAVPQSKRINQTLLAKNLILN
jgi:hypothetical protein